PKNRFTPASSWRPRRQINPESDFLTAQLETAQIGRSNPQKETFAMAYNAEISRSNPTCFVFVLDQSGSMGDVFGGGETNLRKADFLADVANRTLHDLVIRSTKSDEIRDYFSVSIIGYGSSGGGVGSAFVGQLAGRDSAKISEVG